MSFYQLLPEAKPGKVLRIILRVTLLCLDSHVFQKKLNHMENNLKKNVNKNKMHLKEIFTHIISQKIYIL